MNIRDFQEKVIKAFSEMDKMPNRCEHTKQSAIIHLMEEVGEIARQITSEYHRPEKFDRKELGTELADTLMFIVLLSELYDIDISREMKCAVERVKSRVKEIENGGRTRDN